MTTQRPAATPGAGARPLDRRWAIAGGLLLALLALLAAAVVGLALLARSGGLPGAEAGATPPPGGYAYATAEPAPALELTDQDGNPFTLASLRGRPVLVFFGYTHCPDVCPANVGVMNQALGEVGAGPRAVFVSIDPERDQPAAMKSYLRYLPTAYVGLSGTPEAVRTNADRWGVQYARIETGSAGGYAMAHTADIFLVDGQGRLRARFPFGTPFEPIAAALRELLVETPPPSEPPGTPVPTGAPTATPPPTPAPTTTPANGTPAPITGDLHPAIVSSSIWAGGSSPVIFTVVDAMGMPLGGTVALRARVATPDGTPAGPDVDAVAVRPPGAMYVSFIATLDVPSPGQWRLDVTATTGSAGSVPFTALDPGETVALGGPAPDVDTPTLADVGGLALAVTTAAQPDLRLSETSTADARAAGRPYVLVVDSARFKVSPACGRALTMVRYLLDRWSDVAFIHLEPFEYSIVTSEPVLDGDIANPPVNADARAFGLGAGPWDGTKMPWVFVVDGGGTVRAKYTGIVGSADVDVIVSLITATGIVGGA